MRIMRKATLAGLALMLTACAGGVGLDENSKAVSVAGQLPKPDALSPATDFASYRIGPLDEIEITVFNAPELKSEGAVDTAGNFSMPIVGSVDAGGKTPSEVADLVTGKLRGRYIKNPQVAVSIKKVVSRTVTVDGSVREPGVYPVPGRMTLQQAVATARGASEAADINKVVVFRTVNGQKMAAMFSLKDIRSGRYADPDIYGNDIVVVGESSARRFFKNATMSFPLLASFIPIL